MKPSFPSIGALFAAISVALAAYAAHGVDGDAQARLYTAAIFAFGHGVALAALGRLGARRSGKLALAMLSIGTLLFAGSITANVLAGWQLGLTPAGGLLLIAGWVLAAFVLAGD